MSVHENRRTGAEMLQSLSNIGLLIPAAIFSAPLAACSWTELYILRHNKHMKPHVTEADLQLMDAKTAVFDTLFKQVVAPHMPSRAKTNKYHKQRHFTELHRNLGPTKDHNSNFFEMMMRKTKDHYR